MILENEIHYIANIQADLVKAEFPQHGAQLIRILSINCEDMYSDWILEY